MRILILALAALTETAYAEQRILKFKERRDNIRLRMMQQSNNTNSTNATTTQAPATTQAPTTTQASVTTKAPLTTTAASNTTEESATTKAPSTTKAGTTTKGATTTVEPVAGDGEVLVTMKVYKAELAFNFPMPAGASTAQKVDLVKNSLMATIGADADSGTEITVDFLSVDGVVLVGNRRRLSDPAVVVKFTIKVPEDQVNTAMADKLPGGAGFQAGFQTALLATAQAPGSGFTEATKDMTSVTVTVSNVVVTEETKVVATTTPAADGDDDKKDGSSAFRVGMVFSSALAFAFAAVL